MNTGYVSMILGQIISLLNSLMMAMAQSHRAMYTSAQSRTLLRRTPPTKFSETLHVI